MDKFSNENRILKIYLFQAIGKFTRFTDVKSTDILNSVLYLIYSEFVYGEGTTLKSSKTKADRLPALFLIQALLSILNSDIPKTDLNTKYIGSMLKKYIQPLTLLASPTIQRMATQFIT